MVTAGGSFEVSMTPCETSAEEGAQSVARLVLDKTYQGDLTGTGRGQMLGCTTEVEGSAGYVALEVFDGELAGRKGSFVLQHAGLMDRGDATLHVTIVPDSATGELAGLLGHLDITIVDGAHHYELSYELPTRRGS